MPYTLPAVASEYPNVAAPSFWDQAASGLVPTATTFTGANLAACQAARVSTLDEEWFGEWYGTGGGGSQIVGGEILLVPKGGVLTLTELFVHDQSFEPVGGTAAVFFGSSGERVLFNPDPEFTPPGLPTTLAEVESIDDPLLGPGLASFTVVSTIAFPTPFECTGILLSGYNSSNRTRRVFGIYTPDLGPRAAFWEGFVKSREYLRA